jgi:hypothetical protein
VSILQKIGGRRKNMGSVLKPCACFKIKEHMILNHDTIPKPYKNGRRLSMMLQK